MENILFQSYSAMSCWNSQTFGRILKVFNIQATLAAQSRKLCQFFRDERKISYLMLMFYAYVIF